MPIYKLLLFPFSALYKVVTDFRNYLYDNGVKRSIQFDRYVISVGNLTVGGTGKTPFVELLVRLLKPQYKLGILSRGYGRKTKGFRLAGKDDNAKTLGDEPFQYQTKYGDEITVAVGEERAMAIPEMLFQHDDIDIILLDDAYQHRSVTPSLSILLNDFNRPFYRDYLMPAGLLRESRQNATRADLAIVTKCPGDLTDSQMTRIEENISKYTGAKKPVFFTGIKYLDPVAVEKEERISQNVFLFSGIANHKPLEGYVRANYNLIGNKRFPDHYAYTEKDIEGLIKSFEMINIPDKCFLTTEKDMVRLLSVKKQFLVDYPVFYLPIELYFLKNEDSFAKILKSKIDQGISDLGLKI